MHATEEVFSRACREFVEVEILNCSCRILRLWRGITVAMESIGSKGLYADVVDAIWQLGAEVSQLSCSLQLLLCCELSRFGYGKLKPRLHSFQL